MPPLPPHEGTQPPHSQQWLHRAELIEGGNAWGRAVLLAVALVTVSATIIVFFEPRAAGSGIP